MLNQQAALNNSNIPSSVVLNGTGVNLGGGNISYGQPYAQPYGQPYGQPLGQPLGQPYGIPSYGQPYINPPQQPVYDTSLIINQQPNYNNGRQIF